MGTITKREYQVISLYARGLTFKEIGYSLSIATRTAKENISYYNRCSYTFREPLSVKESVAIAKYRYIVESLLFSFKSYNRFKLNLLKKKSKKMNR